MLQFLPFLKQGDALDGDGASRAVTYRAACYLRKQTDIGSVEVGRYADLMVVNGNPLVDVRHLRKVTAVYKGGVRYDPKELLATLPPNPNFIRKQ
jgi:imidazolonepropionase-like amidohydrolase